MKTRNWHTICILIDEKFFHSLSFRLSKKIGIVEINDASLFLLFLKKYLYLQAFSRED
jgi:hypothetical protein